SSGKSDSKDRFELEYTFLPIALLTRESADDERLVLMDDIAQPTAQASSSAGEGAHAANIMPAKAGRKQIWANVPVNLLVQLEPQIRDVRLMEKYLTTEQVEEYVRMLQPMEIDDSTNDTAIG
ncbi:MAG: hypothetical protein PHP20_07635, partial [Firmicutes bacterium]|nr:hypothetical protein [Bacillota bacterium]